jgi:hypothetical protein
VMGVSRRVMDTPHPIISPRAGQLYAAKLSGCSGTQLVSLLHCDCVPCTLKTVFSVQADYDTPLPTRTDGGSGLSVRITKNNGSIVLGPEFR